MSFSTKWSASLLTLAVTSNSIEARAADPIDGTSVAPTQLAVGKEGNGTFQPSALLHAWLYGSRRSVRAPAEGEVLGFRMRRAELKLKGEIVPDLVSYQLMADAARALEPSPVSVTTNDGGTASVPESSGPLTLLGDASVCFQSTFTDACIGQFRLPVSYEGANSSSRILFPERAAVSRFYGDRRDIGLKLEKKLGYVGYTLGLYNGSGQNKLDGDRDKDLALRLEGYPLEGLTVAGVAYGTVGTRDQTTRDRLEADFRYDAHSFYVLAEHIRGWDRKNGQKAVRGHGTYLAVAYTFFDVLQPMARLGDVEPDMRKFGDHYWHYEGGVAWMLQKNEAKVTLSVSIFDPTNTDHVANVKRTDGILAVQAGF